MKSPENDRTVVADFHVHTDEFHPSDKVDDYMKLLQAAVVWGLKAIAITDHNGINPSLWDTLTEDLPESAPFVFPGAEMTTMYKKPKLGFSFKGKPTVSFNADVPFHVGIFGLEPTAIEQVTSQFKKPPHNFATVIKALEGRGLMVTINHPMIPRDPNTSTRLNILRLIGDTDTKHTIRAIEYSASRYQIREIAQTYKWATVGGSDAHVGKKSWENDIGSVGTAIVFSPKDPEINRQEILQRMTTAGAHMQDKNKPGVHMVIRQPDGKYRKYE
jgi:hypothetical protein